MEGSSPRVRGKQKKEGKAALVAEAHPRACGENAGEGHSPPLHPGSSPRVRGKPHPRRVGERLPGLIPARAGKTPRTSQPCKPRGAHPRACGENLGEKLLPVVTAGSSPRVRGKHPRRRRDPHRRGLIPARAGKTRSASRSPPTWRAHPRACGENYPTFPACMVGRGSSPRVRGKPRDTTLQRVSSGLIPARAGKTTGPPTIQSRVSAHPRAYGENQDIGVLDLTASGSSPRVRGKQIADSLAGQCARLIPARAGKTSV